MRFSATLLLLLLTAPALAQTPGACELGRAERDLDVSDVFARLFNTGSIAFGNATVNADGYLVPFHTGKSPLFAAGIWVGGMVGGDLRVAGSTYADFEFWPGPLEDGGALPNPDDCSDYDRIWVVTAEDVARFEATGVPSRAIAEWPAHLGAEVVDGDGFPNNYNPAGGDRPRVYGSQTAFWVMNDVGNTHRNSLTDPIGLEVQVTAFAVASEDPALDQATFYRYRLVNRNPLPLEDAYFAYFMDTDLGDATDDYVGVDTTRGLAFTYNADNDDRGHYGEDPPAFGADFLSDGLGAFAYFIGGIPFPMSDPANGEEMYHFMQGTWANGEPYTEGGSGYQTEGDTTTFTFPGDPVTDAFWSEVSEGSTPGDRRSVSSSPSFTIETGKTKDVWLALVFGQGEDHLDSITELRAASDAVQAAFDDGSLFETVAYDPPVTLPAPTLLGPDGGAVHLDDVSLAWDPVPGADFYRLEIDTEPHFGDRRTQFPSASPHTPWGLPSNTVAKIFWRVRAEQEDGGVSPWSQVGRFVYYRYWFDSFGNGTGIVETANPDREDVCSWGGKDDPGCAGGYPGNAVWLSPNATGDYVLTNQDNSLPNLLSAAFRVVDGESFEVRFTEECAEPGACPAVYASAIPQGSDLIASVPFELWFTGPVVAGHDDPADDVRMIPFLRAYPDTEPAPDWADAFPAEQDVIVGDDTLHLPVTHRVLGLMPDRDGGYALFQEAAQAFGGPGATYDPETDGDTQVDLNPVTGLECARQRYYVDFCWRGGSPLVVAPVGGLNGLVLADLAEDGTTPPAGTTIRFAANPILLEGDGGERSGRTAGTKVALEGTYPNPFRNEASVAYHLEEAADVRLSVYDVLGRRVAVLADGPQGAGAHRARFEAEGLASGLYLVVLEAEGKRETRRLLLVR